ncbi:hypothetical protein [Algoriphagus aquimarinus]|uniref:Uncharacterized protein n=1 Tax=Algoriphagus aquimarinus TaxID=237018 RepID=A0A1I1BSP3_9BACT|nr:hypothetical protein [Algoriphagus aquimarinus]SFB53449.1 hypothetical protein SAMN04489723_11752 [Algoriphagus aquimarinus]
MKDYARISKEEALSTAEDFFALKAKGLSIVQKLSGGLWTDYNSHDPGITILEQLCYGLTDIAFRNNFPIEDLLAEAPLGKIDWKKNSFHAPSKIFSSHPVTLLDFRKLIIDSFEEIQNVWVIPTTPLSREAKLSGLYKIEIMPSLAFQKALTKSPQILDVVKTKVSSFLDSIRNIGEFFEEPVVLKPSPFVLEAKIDIGEERDPNMVFSELLYSIEKYLYQPVAYSSMEELLAENKTLEEIFTGPRLKGGFIKNSELRPRAATLYTESFQRIFSKINGVKKIVNLVFDRNPEVTFLRVKENCYANLTTGLRNPQSIYNTISLYINGNKQSINREIVDQMVLELWSKNFRQYQFDQFKESYLETKLKGRFRALEEYTSIQHHFPIIYGIGVEGLSSKNTSERKAKARQLQGYLLLMEQLMANALMQLANFPELIDPKAAISNPTYFSQKVDSIVNFKSLERELTEKDHLFHKTALDHYSGETEEGKLDRKNRFLDHFLARFGENLDPLPFSLAKKLNLLTSEQELQEVLIKSKANLLSKIDDFNYYRNKGQNLSSSGMSALSGLEQVLYAKTGMNFSSDYLSKQIPVNIETPQVLEVNSSRLENDEKLYQSYRSFSTEEWDKILMPSDASSLTFNKISIKSLFANPLEHNSYLISKSKSLLGNWEVLFQKKHNSWECIWSGSDREDALNRLGATLQHIRNLNKACEGFYLVDHILLGEFLSGSEFGFHLEDSKGQISFSSGYVKSEQERDDLIQDFYTSALVRSNYSVDGNQFKISNEHSRVLASCQIYDLKGRRRGFDELIAETKITVLLMAGTADQQSYFALQQVENIRLKGTLDSKGVVQQVKVVLNRKLASGLIIGEDFFNLRSTLVLPDWPARFQEKHFRYYFEELVKQRVPTHIKLTIHWKNFNDFQKFETVYFKWKNKQHLKSTTDEVRKAELSIYQIIREWEGKAP